MRFILSFYRFLNILSIDIVVGAVVSAMFFAELLQVRIRPFGLIALGLTVWIIYTVDHLRDAKRIKHTASTTRHRFHQEHFQLLSICLVIVILINGVAIFFIRKQVFEFGFLLSCMVAVYLLVQQSLRFLKELSIAALYTCGVLLPSITTTFQDITTIHYLFMFQFGCIAWANLVMFSWFDQVFDKQDRQNSFVTVLGDTTTEYFLYALFTFNGFMSIVQYFLNAPLLPIVILSLMNMTLLFVFIYRRRLGQDDAYRLIGDAIFLIPIALLL